MIYANTIELAKWKNSSQSEESCEELGKKEEEEIPKDKEKEKDVKENKDKDVKENKDKEVKEKDNREREDPLPNGWSKQLDPDTLQTFYTHHTSSDKVSFF